MLVCLHSNRDPRLLEKSRALATVIRLTEQITVTVATGVHQLMVVVQSGGAVASTNKMCNCGIRVFDRCTRKGYWDHEKGDLNSMIRKG